MTKQPARLRKTAMPAPRLRPSIAATLVTLFIVAVCLWLGFWQLDRAKSKAQWLQQQAQLSQSPALSLAQALLLPEPNNQPVTVRGQFDNSHVILLDNRMLGRQAGYHVLTPLRSESGHWVLVNRGWLARGVDRNVLPDIADIDGSVTVSGFTYQYSERTFTLADDDLSSPSWPLRLQKVEFDALAGVLGVDLAPFEIRLNADVDIETGADMPRAWQNTSFGPERHQGYALQWFTMAATAFIFFIVVSLRRRPDAPEEKTS
jgi:surfeit locus 1 family protein